MLPPDQQGLLPHLPRPPTKLPKLPQQARQQLDLLLTKLPIHRPQHLPMHPPRRLGRLVVPDLQQRLNVLGRARDQQRPDVCHREALEHLRVILGGVRAPRAVEDHQLLHALGVQRRELVRDDPPVRDTHEAGLRDPQLIEQRRHDLELVVDAEVAPLGPRAAKPQQVGDDHPVVARERSDLLVPLPHRRGPEPMQQHDRRTLAALEVAHVRVAEPHALRADALALELVVEPTLTQPDHVEGPGQLEHRLGALHQQRARTHGRPQQARLQHSSQAVGRRAHHLH
ncbi:hypothetical protein ENSA7_04440 [Enhygromyxa salina]|uniref:Uncharacterized protein n=1 Tax=Enhygromyxa salina TaxID=215803 RepID=A0A2S9YX83_9BACT|nr:hypothetical protein ENSA7_04440 [Enhygromyxa salina]